MFPVEEKMPATWARTEYMMNKDTNVPVNKPETTHKKEQYEQLHQIEKMQSHISVNSVL